MNTTKKHSHTQAGVTMLEVLVAIVVLSFGLLGMLGLIVNSLKMTSSSHYRTIAGQQLVAMAEVINSKVSVSPSDFPSGSPNFNCFDAACATTDYALFQVNVGSLLPNGRVVVSSASSTSRPKVQICWNESSRIKISGGTTGADDTCLDMPL